MADIEKHMSIAVAPERVREAVLDAATATEWQGTLDEYEQTSPGPPGPGMTSRGVTAVAGRRIEWEAEIVEWSDISFTLRSTVGDPQWEIRWTFAAAGVGTFVTFEQSSPSFEGLKGTIPRHLVGGQAERDLEALRALLEG